MRKVYCIASYNRPECVTVDTLLKAGICDKDIYVSLQKEDQEAQYKAVHPTINYIVREADCAAGNRNTLIDEVGTPLILMDDDIRAFAVKKRGENFKRVEKFEDFSQMMDKAIAHAQFNKCALVGIAANTNDLVARAREEYSVDVLLQGSFLVVIGGGVRFDERWKMVEDYELSLRVILKSHTLRANYLSVIKPKNGENAGGLHERYAAGELPRWIERLEKCYPMFKANKQKTGGRIKFG